MIEIIQACESTTAIVTQPEDYRDWKMKLGMKYRTIPHIQDWNFMVVESSGSLNFSLRVKRSSTSSEFEKWTPDNAKFMLLTDGSEASDPVVPSIMFSAARCQYLRKPLQGKKLTQILEMYDAYTPQERWPETVKIASNITGILDNRGNAGRVDPILERAKAIGDAHGTPEGLARAHQMLRSKKGAPKKSDSKILKEMRERPDSGIRSRVRKVKK